MKILLLTPPLQATSPLVPKWRNGRRRGFKIPRREACRFESGLGYHLVLQGFPWNDETLDERDFDRIHQTFIKMYNLDRMLC